MLHHLLDKAMQQRGLDQAGLARLVGVSHVTVYRWLAEGAVPRSEVLVKLAKAIEVPVEDVLTAAEASAAERRRRRDGDEDGLADEVAELRTKVEALTAELARQKGADSAGRA